LSACSYFFRSIHATVHRLIMTTTATGTAVAGGPDDALLFGSPAGAPASMSISTPALIAAMLDSGTGISDLIFSPGRPPQVEKLGELTPVAIPDLTVLRPEDTARVARDLIAGNAHARQALEQQGAC